MDAERTLASNHRAGVRRVRYLWSPEELRFVEAVSDRENGHCTGFAGCS